MSSLGSVCQEVPMPPSQPNVPTDLLTYDVFPKMCLQNLSGGLLSTGLIAKQNHSGTERLCFHELQSRFVRVTKEPLSTPQNHRVDQEPVFIDHVMLH